ncbi:MAG: hypothetical protein LC790_11430 [Actinobacteria bacterium]|nr:hypothetical protein [Actinomycetota bacterium]
MPLKRQLGGAAGLLAALEDAWQAVRARHPDVPAAQIIVAQGSGSRGGLVLGHLAPDRWQPSAHGDPGKLVHELLIGGEGLALGATDVFGTVLHEAAHALAIARQIADTSRDGRYHNHLYRQLAEELGLIVQRSRHLGWNTTTLSPATRQRYAPQIAGIDAAITRHRLPEPSLRGGRNLAAAACGCPRRIRVAAGTLLAGAITCELCGEAFTTQPAIVDAGGGGAR